MAKKRQEINNHRSNYPEGDGVFGGNALHLFLHSGHGVPNVGNRVLKLADATFKLTETIFDKIAAGASAPGLAGIGLVA